MLIIHSGRFIFSTEVGEVGLDLGVLEVHLLAGVVDEGGSEGAVRTKAATMSQ